MTSKRILDQINTIRQATEKASASPEAALEFLRKAGIIPRASQVAGTDPEKLVSTNSKTSVPRATKPNRSLNIGKKSK